MPKEKKMSDKRVILSLPAELRERVRQFRFANEINTESEAMRQLLEIGLDASSKPRKGRKAE